MNLAFWTEALKRAKKLREGVVKLDGLAKQGRISEMGVLFDRLREPSQEFRDHCLSRELSCGARDLPSLLVSAACLQISLQGWEMFCALIHNKDFNPIAFISAWRTGLEQATHMFHDKCREEAAPTN